MGVNQSTNRAAKFSGSTRKSIRLTQGAPASAPTVRRQLSQRNINRNVKEFSRFWSGGGSFRPKGTSGNRRSESVRRSNSVRRNRPQSAEPSRKSSRGLLTPVSTPQSTPRPMHNSYAANGPSLPRPAPGPRNFEPSLPPPPPRYEYHDDVIIDNVRARIFDSNPERLHALQFPHETAIY
ncbi:unnamed protein product [Cylicostephanus goldi]|uniref:Uncharacterized protein n=1 Tax=Cylicostephanus goldi TaxID=71465 RepID=A0A3P6QPP9_CYLGO|nr:unnamed protein product [Cylicostephanus goldi]